MQRVNISVNNDVVIENVEFTKEQIHALQALSAHLDKRNILMRIVEAPPVEIHHKITEETEVIERGYGPDGGLETALNMIERAMRKSTDWYITFDGFEDFNGIHRRLSIDSAPLMLDDGVIGFNTVVNIGSWSETFNFDLNDAGNFINGHKEFILKKIKERI